MHVAYASIPINSYDSFILLNPVTNLLLVININNNKDLHF